MTVHLEIIYNTLKEIYPIPIINVIGACDLFQKPIRLIV